MILNKFEIEFSLGSKGVKLKDCEISKPENFEKSHQLCFLLHDIMVEMLCSGEKKEIFTAKLNLTKDDQLSIGDEGDILGWMHDQKRFEERDLLVKSTILPAMLSDMMSCIYEAISAASKGKMTIAFMLIRKPIQESLYVLESMVLDEREFVDTLFINPMKLRPKNGGGIDGHTERVFNTLKAFKMEEMLDSRYLAQLRYNKNEYDSFDGVCNQAMHLFTEHHAIKTENMNINFIFSGGEQLPSQWKFFYTRLPYLLLYIYLIFEYILSSIAQTPESYLNEMMRRIASSFILTSDEVPDLYETEERQKLVSILENWLNDHCTSAGYLEPNRDDLIRMSQEGGFPRVL